MNKSKAARSYTTEALLYLFIAESVYTCGQLWYLYFGANNHMSPFINLFNNCTLVTTPKPVLLGDNNSYIIQGIVSIIL